MSLILGSFTVERLAGILEREKVRERVGSSTLVLPGLAAPLRDEVASVSGLTVDVGPVCAAELPLFFGDRWL
jgi:CO dehydrogenase/acetyl-CoA synthase gamma subunit (corrinoid Fe-S protein)